MIKKTILHGLLFLGALGYQPGFSRIAVTGSEDQYSYSALLRDPYVSGSLGFINGNPAMSHLKVGAKIPIRLGKTTRTQIPANTLPSGITTSPDYHGQAIYEYEDNGSAGVVGYINIISIDVNSINFNYTLYNPNGTLLKNSSAVLNLNGKADLNGDGNSDVEYVNQINTVRPANSTSRYLRFISSQTALTSNGYCYMPEYLPTLSYANGNLGYNQDGNAVIRPIAKTALGKIAVPSGTDIQVGDFIMNTDQGNYIQVSNGPLAKSAASIDQLVSASTPVDNISSVFATIHFVSSQANFALAKSSAAAGMKAYPTLEEYQAARAQASAKLSEYQFTMTFPSFNGTKTLSSGIKVGIENITAHLGIDADVDITWHRAKGKVGGMVLIDGNPTLGFSKTTNFISEKNQDIQIPMSALASTSFWAGPVLVNLSIIPELGCLLNVSIKPSSKMYNTVFMATGFTSSFSVGWTGASGSSDNFFMSGLYADIDMASSVGFDSYVRPYIGIGPRVDIYGILYAQLTARRWIGPELSSTFSADQLSSTTTLGLYNGQNLHLKAGAKVGISFFGHDFYKSWEPIVKDFAETKNAMIEWKYTTPVLFDAASNTKYSSVAATGASVRTSYAGGNLAFLPSVFSLLE